MLCTFLNKNELDRKLNLDLIFTKGKYKHREKIISCFSVIEVRSILSSINIESKGGKQLNAILSITYPTDVPSSVIIEPFFKA